MTDDGTPRNHEDGGTSGSVPAQTAASESVHTGAPQGTAAKKGRLGLFIFALVALLIVGGGAAAGVLYAIRGTSDVLIGKVPADSLVYATIYLDPAAGQKINVARLAEKFPALRGESLGTSLDRLMNEALGGTGMSFRDDIEPWMGSQVGIALVADGDEPGLALLVDSEDDAAAMKAMDQLKGPGTQSKQVEYEGTTIWKGGSSSMAMVDGTVVFGDSEYIIERVIDTANGGKSLSSNDAYTDTTLALPKQRLASAFVNGAEVVDMIERQAVAGAAGSVDRQLLGSLGSFEGLGMTLSAESDGISMKFASSIDTSKLPNNPEKVKPHRNAVLEWTPQDSYGLMAGTGLKGTLRGMKDRMEEASPGSSFALDMFGLGAAIDSLQGDYGLVVSPGTDGIPAGAFMMASNNDPAMQDFMDSVSILISRSLGDGLLERTVTSQSGPVPLGDEMLPIKMTTPTWQTEDYEGVSISFLEIPGKGAEVVGFTPAYAVSDGMAMIATSPDEVKALLDTRDGESLAITSDFNSAMAHADEENTGLMFIDTAQIVDAVGAKATTGGMDAETMANLEPVRSVVMTSGGTSARPTATVFVLIP